MYLRFFFHIFLCSYFNMYTVVIVCIFLLLYVLYGIGICFSDVAHSGKQKFSEYPMFVLSGSHCGMAKNCFLFNLIPDMWILLFFLFVNICCIGILIEVYRWSTLDCPWWKNVQIGFNMMMHKHAMDATEHDIGYACVLLLIAIWFQQAILWRHHVI